MNEILILKSCEKIKKIRNYYDFLQVSINSKCKFIYYY